MPFTIVFAEDDHKIVTALVRHLRLIGTLDVDVLEAPTQEKLLELCRTYPQIDIIFINYLLPVRDNVQADTVNMIAGLKNSFPAIKLVAFTGIDHANIKLMQLVGCEEYVALKPLDVKGLKDFLDYIKSEMAKKAKL